MSTPTGDNAFLHTLELNVRAELTLAETSRKRRPSAYRSTSGCPIRRMPRSTKLACVAFLARSRPWKTPPAPATILRRPKCQRADRRNKGGPRWAP